MKSFGGAVPLPLLTTRVLAAASPTATQAAPTASSRVALDQAEALAAEAQAEFKAGAFDQAARLYMQAYGKSGKASVVYNAARAYEEAGNVGEAIALFRLYLSLSPDADGVVDARARIQKLEALRASKAAVVAELRTAAAPAPTVAPLHPALLPGGVGLAWSRSW